MPTYDYECEACGHSFELFQSMTAAVKRKCPECSKNKLQRLIGRGGAILFKGGGFYETDYRSEGYQKDKAADGSSSAKDSSSKDSSSTDSKSDGASKPKTDKKKPKSGGGGSKKKPSSGGSSD